MNDNTLDNPFWQYACRLYKKPGIEDLLLELQDNHHWNIPVALLMLWLGKQGMAIARGDIHRFIAVISRLDSELVHPLRSIRRYIKTCPDLSPALYTKAKELELDIEQAVISRLYIEAKKSSFVQNETSCIPANLSRYASENSTEQVLILKLLELVE